MYGLTLALWPWRCWLGWGSGAWRYHKLIFLYIILNVFVSLELSVMLLYTIIFTRSSKWKKNAICRPYITITTCIKAQYTQMYIFFPLFLCSQITCETKPNNYTTGCIRCCSFKVVNVESQQVIRFSYIIKRTENCPTLSVMKRWINLQRCTCQYNVLRLAAGSYNYFLFFQEQAIKQNP